MKKVNDIFFLYDIRRLSGFENKNSLGFTEPGNKSIDFYKLLGDSEEICDISL